MAVGIVRGAVNLVVALKIGQRQGHVRLAEDDDAGGFQLLYRFRILGGDVVLPDRVAPGSGSACQVEGFLDGHGHTVEGPQALSPGQCLVGSSGTLQGQIPDIHHDGVQCAVVSIDPIQVELEQLDSGDLFFADGGGQLGGRGKNQVAHGTS